MLSLRCHLCRRAWPCRKAEAVAGALAAGDHQFGFLHVKAVDDTGHDHLTQLKVSRGRMDAPPGAQKSARSALRQSSLPCCAVRQPCLVWPPQGSQGATCDVSRPSCLLLPPTLPSPMRTPWAVCCSRATRRLLIAWWPS